MEIPLDEQWLKQLYTVLIQFYKNTSDPIRSGYPLVSDYNDGMLNVCVSRPKTKLFGQEMYPHVMQKAAITMHSIINFHPFVDGNKRIALLSVYYYLLWNGYTFTIPNDADVALINFAKNHSHPNIILDWLKLNTKRTVWNVIRHWQCETLSDNGKVSLSDVFINRMLIPIFLPRDGFFYFRDKIINEQRRRRLQNRTRDPSYT